MAIPAVLTSGASYATPAQAVLDDVVSQTFYRQLGIMAINFGTKDVFSTAQYLSANSPGPT